MLRNMLKKSTIVSLILLFYTIPFVNAITYEHIQLYETTFSKGAGKALTSVDFLGINSFLANPASSVSPKFSFNLLTLPIYINANTLQVIEEIMGGSLSGDNVLPFLIDQIGKSMYLGLPPSILNFSIPFDTSIGKWGVNFGLNLSLNFFLEAHNPLSSAGLLDIIGYLAITPYIGFSYSFKNFEGQLTGNRDIDNYIEKLSLGINLKFLTIKGINRNITLEDIVLNRVDQIVSQDIGSLFSLSDSKFLITPDIGLLYKIPLDEANGENQRVNIGLVIKDIGGFSIGDQAFPTRFNLGASYFFTLQETGLSLKKNAISLDIHDIFFQLRDKDFFKRLHIGIISEAFNLNDVIILNLGLGISQGYPTFGTELKLAIFKFAYSVNVEELGVYAGQDPDIRHTFSLSIGW